MPLSSANVTDPEAIFQALWKEAFMRWSPVVLCIVIRMTSPDFLISLDLLLLPHE